MCVFPFTPASCLAECRPPERVGDERGHLAGANGRGRACSVQVHGAANFTHARLSRENNGVNIT